MQRHIQFRIPQLYAGLSLVDFLVQRFPYHDRMGWLERITQCRIGVNGQTATAAHRLAVGELVEYLAADIPEPRVNLDIAVVFEDADLLVVDKPPNLPSHPAGRYFQHTLWAVLKTRFGLEHPTLINRLDRETSGLMVVAKNEPAARHLRAEFSSRRVEKKYLALVEGAFPPHVATRGLLVPDTASPVTKKKKFVAAETPPSEKSSQWAETVFQGLETWSLALSKLWKTLPNECGHDGARPSTSQCELSTYTGGPRSVVAEGMQAPLGLAVGPISLIEVTPTTGRLHQIRATLQALGFPIVGDKLYGHDPALFIRFCKDQLTAADHAVLRMERQALHATMLRLQHPLTHRRLELEAPLPADMAALLAELREP